ncbi:MAG: hypothetical protein RL329_117, partial [Bacteroidota bacterium]
MLPLNAVSPIDGRYHRQTEPLNAFFSEYALIRYRVFVEIQYFIALCQLPLPQLVDFDKCKIEALNEIAENFNIDDALIIKEIEKITNHDVKAVEYFLRDAFDKIGLEDFKEFIHFGLTSQDVNNTAIPLSTMHAVDKCYLPLVQSVRNQLKDFADKWQAIPMLARTHG